MVVLNLFWNGKTPEINEEVLVYNPTTKQVITDTWFDYGEGIGFENTDEDTVFWMSYPKFYERCKMKQKFRAWDKTSKEMYLADEINWDRGEFESIGDGITFYRGAEEVELMLFTNTVDKNSDEIFEGDVLQIDYIKAIVRFGQYRYYDSAGKNVLTGNGFYLECLNVMDPDCISPYETDVLDKAEVIGNIYENPEYDQNFIGFRIKGE